MTGGEKNGGLALLSLYDIRQGTENKDFFVTTTLLFQFFTGIKGLKVLIHLFIPKNKDRSKPYNDHHNNDKKKKKKREEGT